MSNSVLLTGGLGYLGGRLACSLVANGYEVRCGTRRGGMVSPDWLTAMSMVELDWTSIEALTEACRGVNHVIHLAAMNEVESAVDPVGALQMNGLASLRLLEAAKAAGVRRFVYFSTAHVYGAPLQGVIDETTLPRPVHPYAITHKVAEDFILAAHDKKHIEGIVIRLSNGFGAPATPNVDRWTLLVNDLCRQAVTTGKLRLNSAGTQLRNFVTLWDVTRAVNHLLQLDIDQLGDGLFNLGGGHSMSILEMAERVASRWRMLTGRDIEVIRPAVDGLPAPALDYRSNKLAATGFTLSGQVDREIDDTLTLCLHAFGK
ncbi:SDR family oxidoreductase [uncultured Propionivibrio sp.]|uniref:NAD-dependent epimerase/dehydratase family protein n=1 Tax=uncultured Propionivibrio sp. TaxID=426737 RepID=UPI0029C0023F|nr:SDR family oxidoreductase [uncultured Propionivibrio sp.]